MTLIGDEPIIKAGDKRIVADIWPWLAKRSMKEPQPFPELQGFLRKRQAVQSKLPYAVGQRPCRLFSGRFG
ncbi:hypothetical protein D3C87_1912410 [compost metagenome]